MNTKTKTNLNQEETPVLHESNLPLTQKPSFLFIVSTSLGVITIVLVAINAYYGIIRF